MKTLTASLLLSLFSLNAHADIIECDFTEPFFSLVIDTQKKTVVKEGAFDENGPETIATNAVVKFIGLEKTSDAVHVPVYSVMDGKKEIVQLKLNYEGSNGMGEDVYPYDAFYAESEDRKHFGGCESEKVKRYSPTFEENKI